MSNKLEQTVITDPYGKESECGMFTVDTPGAAFVLSNIATPGQLYTFSCWVRSDSDSMVSVNGSSFQSAAEWARRSVAIDATDEDIRILFGNTGTYYIYHPQLEEGNVSTDWTPAPEDVEQSVIDETANVRAGLLDKYAQLQETCDGIVSTAGQTYVRIDDYGVFKEDTESKLSQVPGQIRMEFSKVETMVSEVDGSLQTVKNSIAKHIEFSSDNAITIGGDSGIVLTVDNDNGIIFSKIVRQDGTKLADSKLASSNVRYQVSIENGSVPTGEWLTSIPKIPSGHYLWIRRHFIYLDDTLPDEPTEVVYTVYSVAFGSWDGNDFYTGNIVVKLNERAQLGNFAFVPRSDGSLSFLKVGG